MSLKSVPPFPDDVPTAPLVEVSLSALLRHDQAAEDQLWDAACSLGFFYLNLCEEASAETSTSERIANGHHNPNGEHINGHFKEEATNEPQQANREQKIVHGNKTLATVEELFKVAEEVFNQPMSEKQKYDYAEQGSYFGYKGFGSGVIDAAGTRDRNEFYNISKDAILQIDPNPLPSLPVLDKHKQLIQSFIQDAHAISTDIILPVLNDRLHLPTNTLSSKHRLQAAAGDQVRFVHAPPQPANDRQTALGAHTDFGSVTVLFAHVGGLQVLLPGEQSWAYVRPLPGRAIINLGDALVKFSAGELRSNVHCVAAPPGAQAECTKFSVVYFCRPEDEVLLQPLRESEMVKKRLEDGTWKEEGEAVNSKDWVLRRALTRRGLKGGWRESGGTEEQ